MVESIKIKRKNKIKNAETRMAVHIYLSIVYCYLENKITKICKFIKLDKKIKDRTMLTFKSSIGLSSYVLYEEKI